MILFLQRLDECLVEERDSSLLSQLPANGATAAAELTVNRDDKFLVYIHDFTLFAFLLVSHPFSGHPSECEEAVEVENSHLAAVSRGHIASLAYA